MSDLTGVKTETQHYVFEHFNHLYKLFITQDWQQNKRNMTVKQIDLPAIFFVKHIKKLIYNINIDS